MVDDTAVDTDGLRTAPLGDDPDDISGVLAYSEKVIENAVDVSDLHPLNAPVDKRITTTVNEGDEDRRMPVEREELKWLAGNIEDGERVTVAVRVLEVKRYEDDPAELVVADETAATAIKVPDRVRPAESSDVTDPVEELSPGDSVLIEDLDAVDAAHHYTILRWGLDATVTVWDEWDPVPVDAPVGVVVDVESELVNRCEAYEYSSKEQARERVVNAILDEFTIVDVTGTELTWMYDDTEGVWVKYADEELDSMLAEYLPPEANTDRERSQIIKNVKALSRERENPITIGTPDDPDNRYRIGVENGVVDVRKPIEGEECLLDDAPEHKLTDKLPVEFDPVAECPKIDEVIRQICGGENDKVKVVYEIFGHVLMRNYDRRQAVIKLGPEESGKSFLDTILAWLVGDENVEAASLEKLMGGSFETAALKQSLVVVDDDSTNKKLKDAQFLKKAVGSGSLRVDEKNVNRETIDNSATVILNANNPPVFGGTPEGVRSRVLPVVFNQKFTDDPDPANDDEHEKRDEAELREELMTDEELSGLLNKAIKGAQRLIEDGWSDGRTADERWQLYNEWADDVESALAKCFTEKAGAVMTKEHAYSVYVAYCHKNGLEPTAPSQFWKLARKSDLYFETSQRNDGTRTVKHIMLTPEAMKFAPDPVREAYAEDVEGGELSHPLDEATDINALRRWNKFATVEATIVAREVYPNGVVELTVRDGTGATTRTRRRRRSNRKRSPSIINFPTMKRSIRN